MTSFKLLSQRTLLCVRKHWRLLQGGIALVCAFGAPGAATQARAEEFVQPATADEKKASAPNEEPQMAKAEGKEIVSVVVQGTQRIEKDAVLARMKLKPGSKVTALGVSEDIQNLYSMGYFEEIKFAAEDSGKEGVQLFVSVKERPVITKISFDGNESLDSSDLKEVIKVKEYSILDVGKVREDITLLQRHYEEKGYYLAKISFEVRTLQPDQVELIYKINDYEKVLIKKITFLNNKAFSDEQLKAVFAETKEGSALSGLTGTGSFKESSFKIDLDRLKYWYLDHGYIKFRFEAPVVTVSDDKKFLYISLYVEEGDQYRVGDIDFAGDLLFSKEELSKPLTLNKGDVFALSKRGADILKLTEKYEDLGYAFTNVITDPNPSLIDDEKKIIHLTYQFEKGNLTYFGEFNASGNTKTYDKVIRRELKVKEGELFHGTRLRESRENVERLGFFQPGEVIFNRVVRKDQPDVVDIEILVKERQTGTITLGAGYGTIQKFFLMATIQEANLFGRGQNLTFSGQFSAQTAAQTFNLGFTDPYAFDTRWSLGADIFWVVTPWLTHETRKLGFNVRAGYPLSDYVLGMVTYKNEGMRILRLSDGVDRDIVQTDEGVLSSLVWSLVRDRRNNRFEPTGGSLQSITFETAGLGGDKKFLKAGANTRFYARVIGDLVFRTSQEIGTIKNLIERDLPYSERFLLGGPNNMKGFRFGTLGPYKIAENGRRIPIGGTFQAYSLFELEHPLIKEAGIKVVTFFDIGNVWERAPGWADLDFRMDYGFGIRWFSPIGPLRFEWGFPVNRRPGEGIEFNFFIGPPF